MSENDGDEMILETEYAALDAETLDRDAPPGESSVTALRALQERARLSGRLANRVGAGGAKQSQARFDEYAREAREQAEVIRRLLAGNGSGSDG